MTDAYKEGYKDYYEGNLYCPYLSTSEYFEDWMEGYGDAYWEDDHE